MKSSKPKYIAGIDPYDVSTKEAEATIAEILESHKEDEDREFIVYTFNREGIKEFDKAVKALINKEK